MCVLCSNVEPKPRLKVLEIEQGKCSCSGRERERDVIGLDDDEFVACLYL